MNWRLRPRFRLRIALSAREVVERFGDHKDSGTAPFDLYIEDRQVEMSVDAGRRHFWSPYLKLRLEQQQNATVLKGTFGPNINVWSMFLAAYAVCVLTGSTGLIIGVSQLLIDQSPVGLWLTAGGLAASTLIWAAGQIGQRLAYDQMVAIHLFVHELFVDVLTDGPYCEACDNDLAASSLTE